MNKMNKKKLLGLSIAPSKYLIITNSDSQDKKETATYITSQKAKKLLKDENFCDYLFKVSNVRYCSNILLKYPLSRFYICNGINEVFDDVWCSLNVENVKNKEKDFTEYIELKPLFNEECKIFEIKIEYHKISIS
jgi:hypothetical protein